MSSYSTTELVDAFPKAQAPSWRAGAGLIATRIWTFWTRQQQRQELLDYIASDYRAAADVGITSGEARSWPQRPFWRA